MTVVDEMSFDKKMASVIFVDEMTRKRTVGEMTVDEMAVDKMIVTRWL